MIWQIAALLPSFHIVSAEPERPEWAVTRLRLQPSTGQKFNKFQMCVCVYVCMCAVCLIEDTDVHTCASLHWLRQSLSSLFSSLTPATPASRELWSSYCFMQCSLLHVWTPHKPHSCLLYHTSFTAQSWYRASQQESRTLYSMYSFL